MWCPFEENSSHVWQSKLMKSLLCRRAGMSLNSSGLLKNDSTDDHFPSSFPLFCSESTTISSQVHLAVARSRLRLVAFVFLFFFCTWQQRWEANRERLYKVHQGWISNQIFPTIKDRHHPEIWSKHFIYPPEGRLKDMMHNKNVWHCEYGPQWPTTSA